MSAGLRTASHSGLLPPLAQAHNPVCVTEERWAAMGIRTSRFDDRAEGTLAEPRARIGLSVSARHGTVETPYAVFRRLDLGPGGYAAAPAVRAKTAVAAVIGEKHRR